jgi:ankyrin repeat protein
MPRTIGDPNYQGPFGNTLLHSAVVSGDIREVERLLAAGADPRIANRDGHTALHAAAIFGHGELQELLARASRTSSAAFSAARTSRNPPARER